MAERLPVAVPRFEMLCLERGLVGYRIIRGDPLDEALLERHPEKAGSALGQFIAALHGFDVADALSVGVPVNPLGVPGSYLSQFSQDQPLDPGATAEENQWRETFERARTTVVSAFAPYLSPADAAAASAVFDAVLDDKDAFDFRPVLVHTELVAEHTLFDQDEGDLAGVIDWSDACISDPVADLALALTLPSVAGAALVAAYGGEVGPALRRRVRAYSAVGAYAHLQHALGMRDDAIKAAAVAQLAAVSAEHH